MRSLADRLRLERALRVAGLLSLALWIAAAAWPRGERIATLRGDALESELARVTAVQATESLHVELDTVPSATNAQWLAALRGAGVGVSWSGPAGGALALEAFRSAEPTGGLVLLATAPQASSVVSDALGPIDTIAVAGAPALLRLASVEGDVMLKSGMQPARVGVEPGVAPKRVFVSGAAGWEAKFAIAALEESGWAVDARLFIRPDDAVVQGGAGRPSLDTSRYAVVLLMDSAAAETTRGVAEFARDGGGVVLAGDANRSRRLAGIMGWRARARESAPLGTLPADTSWRGLSRLPFDSLLDRRALALETRGGRAVVAARRHHAGRVLGIGYDQTWRWRMAGGANSVADHRAWWSGVIASAAPAVIPTLREAPNVIRSEAKDLLLPSGSAPLASLHQSLGPPSASANALASRFPTRLLSNLLGLLALAALLAEWFLRRARGAR